MPKKRQDTTDLISNFLRHVFSVGREALAKTEEEADKIIKSLVERGQVTEDEGRRIFKEFLHKLHSNRKDLQSLIDERVRTALKAISIPTIEELQELEDKIDALHSRLDALLEAQKSAKPPKP